MGAREREGERDVADLLVVRGFTTVKDAANEPNPREMERDSLRVRGACVFESLAVVVVRTRFFLKRKIFA